ncbi:aminotransferase, class III [Ostertagia ostertagi]
MAIRLARAHTGKDKILRFLGHFHGWHDHVTAGAGATYDGGTTPGVPQEVASLSIVMPQSDVAAVVKVIEERDDIAAVMFEPSGASWGQAPLPPGFVQAVRDATAKKGVVMLMDEVITGYRWSSGGAQKAFGITPDLCIQAKIVAGGLPGGAVLGQARDHGPHRPCRDRGPQDRAHSPSRHLQRQPAVGRRRRHRAVAGA